MKLLKNKHIKPLIPQDTNWNYMVGEAGALEFARMVEQRVLKNVYDALIKEHYTYMAISDYATEAPSEFERGVRIGRKLECERLARVIIKPVLE